MASIPSSAGTIQACVKSTGSVRIVDTAKGQRCYSSETQVTWTKMRYRGNWSATSTYTGGDIAVRNGSAYQAKTTSKGKDPATQAAYWGLLAARGATGPQGPVGPLPTAKAASSNTLVDGTPNPGTSVSFLSDLDSGTYTVTGRISPVGLANAQNVFCTLFVKTDGVETQVDGNLTSFTVQGIGVRASIPLVSTVTVPTSGSTLTMRCYRSGSENVNVWVRLLAVPIGGVEGDITGI